MDLSDLIGRRRMTRAFLPDALLPGALDAVLEAARRAPSAGNSQGVHVVVLEGAEQTRLFWDVTLPEPRRSTFAWPHLLDAPVLLLPLCEPGAYLRRYREPDKEASGLGRDEASWPVPYWLVDASFATMLMMLVAHDHGIGSLFFAVFRGEAELLARLGVPDGLRPIGALALGLPRTGSRPGRSASRPRRPTEEVIHRGGW